MKRLRTIAALVLVLLGIVSAGFWACALQGSARMGYGGHPTTPAELQERFPALALAVRLHRVDLFAPRDSEEAMTIVWRLEGQFLCLFCLSTIAASVGLLLLTACMPQAWPRWIPITARIAIVVLIGLQAVALMGAWLEQDETPNMVQYPPQTEPRDSTNPSSAEDQPE